MYNGLANGFARKRKLAPNMRTTFFRAYSAAFTQETWDEAKRIIAHHPVTRMKTYAKRTGFRAQEEDWRITPWIRNE